MLTYLPAPEEQNWLVARLAELIASGGREQFLDMPIVEPARRFFPDPWTYSHRGLDRLVRRLMQYAGLNELDVKIGTYVELGERNPASTWHGHRSTAGLFMGIADGQCLFAFNENAPADAEYMSGVMCHEVAHAYRAHHRLGESVTSVEEEECITDVTTVYLGFGILSANNSLRYRTAGWNEGALAFHSWSAQSTGYLPPQAFAFLLANQIVARDLSSTERHRLLKHLEPDQAAFTKAALQAVWERQADTMQALRLNPKERRDTPNGLKEILQPLPEYAGPEPPAASTAANEAIRFNQGRPVFRVPKNRVHQFAAIGAVLGMGIGLIGALVIHRVALFALGALAGVAIGIYRGYRTRFEVCSDPECKAILAPADTCPNCGGHVAWSIKHENDRLEAEEEWERRAREQSAERPRARKIRRVATNKDDTA